MYVIKNAKTNSYFQKRINKNLLHFVVYVKDAKKFKSKKQCEEIVITFKNKKDYEVIEWGNL